MNPLCGTRWTCTWVSVGGRTITAATMAYLRIDPPAAATGRGGVNRFSSPVELASGESGTVGTIGFPEIISTRMGGPQESMDLERTYFEALRAARRFEIKGNELTLFSEAGAVATFKAFNDG